jgi:protein-tyrosine phosphatase
MFFFKKKFHLVIVCTANRTRSAYFAGYLKHYLSQYRPDALKRIKITSAGTKASGGGRVNDVVALIARNNGFSLRQHTAEPLSDRMMKCADLILVMEQEHKDFILEKYPQAKEKVFRLMEYGWQGEDVVETLDVPDPTGRNAEDFKAFIETAHVEADRLVHELVHREVI